MKTTSKSFALWAMLLLAGCSTMPPLDDVQPGYSLSKAQADGDGLLIGSITTDTLPGL